MKAEDRKLIIATLVAPSLLFYCYIVFVYDFDFWPYTPSRSIQVLMLGRAILFGIFGIAGGLLIAKAFQSGNLLQRVKMRVIFVLAMVLGSTLLTARIENNLHPISCCGDGPYTEWGYPYGWIGCWRTSFCGISAGAEFDWLALVATLIFWSSAAICVIGLSGSLVRWLRMGNIGP